MRPSTVLPARHWWVVLMLCGSYLGVVLAAIFPVALSNPAWQLNLAQVLVGNGFLPLLALALARLIAFLDPSTLQLRRLDRLRRPALVAAAGFLLLIPIYWIALATDLAARVSEPARQVAQAREAIARVRTAAIEAPSFAAFEQRLQEQGLPLSGGGTSGGDPGLPFPQRRQLILANLERSEAALPSLPDAQAPLPWPQLLQGTLRVCLPAMLLAAAFAALSEIQLLPWALRPFSRSARRRIPNSRN